MLAADDDSNSNISGNSSKRSQSNRMNDMSASKEQNEKSEISTTAIITKIHSIDNDVDQTNNGGINNSQNNIVNKKIGHDDNDDYNNNDTNDNISTVMDSTNSIDNNKGINTSAKATTDISNYVGDRSEVVGKHISSHTKDKKAVKDDEEGNEKSMSLNTDLKSMKLGMTPERYSVQRRKRIQLESSSSDDESEIGFEISLLEDEDDYTLRSERSTKSKSKLKSKMVMMKVKKIEQFVKSKSWKNMQKLPTKMAKQYEKYDDGLYETEQAIMKRLQTYANEATDTINHDRFIAAMKDKTAMLEQFKTECNSVIAVSKQSFQTWIEKQASSHKQVLHQLKIETSQQQLVLKELSEEVKLLKQMVSDIKTNATPTSDAIARSTMPTTTPVANRAPKPTITTPIPSTPISNPEGRESIHVPNPYQNYPYDRIKFHHQGNEYVLNDKYFAKNHPQLPKCQSVDDAFTLYNIIQQHTAPYNIMITKISDLTKWNREPGSTPPTCAMEYSNTTEYYQAYQAMKIAIYNLLTKVDFSKVGMYQAFIKHETNQDGFSALYSIMAMCHPKLMKRPRMECPTLKKSKNNFFQLCRSYQNYLDYESIENRTHSPESQLEYIIAQLDTNDKYKNAIMEMNTIYRIYQATIRAGTATPFPMELLLKNLPFTIISTFPPEEQAAYNELDDNMSPITQQRATINMMNDSFDDEESMDDIDAIIHRLGNQYGSRGNHNNGSRGYRNNKSKRMSTDRKRIDKTCPACGRHGHHIFENGCDFTAAHLKCIQFLQRYPEVKEQLMKNQKMHEGNRRQSFLQKGAMKKIFKRRAKDAKVHTVEGLINVLSDTIDEALVDAGENVQQSDSNDDIFLESYENQQGQAEEEEV